VRASHRSGVMIGGVAPRLFAVLHHLRRRFRRAGGLSDVTAISPASVTQGNTGFQFPARPLADGRRLPGGHELRQPDRLAGSPSRANVAPSADSPIGKRIHHDSSSRRGSLCRTGSSRWRNLWWARCAFCFMAPGVEPVARATSLMLIPSAFSLHNTSRCAAGNAHISIENVGSIAALSPGAVASGRTAEDISWILAGRLRRKWSTRARRANVKIHGNRGPPAR
jgi:hypothetical protein